MATWPTKLTASGLVSDSQAKIDSIIDMFNIPASPTDNYILKYDAATTKFELEADTGGGGGIALTDLSVGTEGTPSGDGALSYDNTTGVFTYTPATLSGLGLTNTDDLTEGSTNLYYTTARANTDIDAKIATTSIGDLSDVDTTGVADNKILKYNSTTSKFEIADDDSSGVAGNPAGSSGEIQYNDSGSFGADQYFYITNPGGGTSCTFNHKGHLNTGLGVGASISAITSGNSVWQQSHTGGQNFRIETGGTIGTKIGGNTPELGFYPDNTNLSQTGSYMEVSLTTTDDLAVLFKSNGTGTADIRVNDLPTSDPLVAGQLWNDSGTMKISAG